MCMALRSASVRIKSLSRPLHLSERIAGSAPNKVLYNVGVSKDALSGKQRFRVGTSTRFYSSSVKKPEENEKPTAAAVEGMVLEYTEGLRQPYQKKIDVEAMSKTELAIYLGNKIGQLERELVAKDLLLKRVSVAYYLRTRMDRLQWTLTEDIDVRNELNHANVKVIIPPDISPDGQTSYRSRYRIWHAIMIVMQTKKNGFVAEVKAVFDTVGLPWQDPEMMASIFAKLFNHLSAEVKNNEFDIDVEWENEEELLEICAKRSVKDPKELCAVKAIYRLKP